MSISSAEGQFVGTVVAILSRYSRQNGIQPVVASDAERIGRQLWTLIETRGLPRGLAVEEMGEPGEMSADEVAPLIAAMLNGVVVSEGLSIAARQMVKACFHPEFRKCRDSYRELTGEGVCRRQQIERAVGRVSGSHCVDCPYWTALTEDQHRTLLRENWRGDPSLFDQCGDVFLPEDFRALRELLRAIRR